MSNFLELYDKITRLPFGKFFFNKGIGIVAPFFGKIRPNIIRLEPYSCEVQMKDRWGVRNHIGTVNAGAMCTLAELTGGLAMDASLPAHLRWIPKNMSVEYLCKAKGMLTATCTFDEDVIQEGETVLPVVVGNEKDEKVFVAEITFHISKKRESR